MTWSFLSVWPLLVNNNVLANLLTRIESQIWGSYRVQDYLIKFQKQCLINVILFTVVNADKENIPTNEKHTSLEMTEKSLDEQLNSIYAEHCAKIANIKSRKDTMSLASKLENIVSYLFESKAPKNILYIGFLEYFIHMIPSQPGER